jgi:antitoxin component of RelBE/YafQ-DinJ toxin-antitoxin module
MAKNVLIRARVTRQEREEIHAIAKMRDTTVSEMIRSLAQQPISVNSNKKG